LPRQVFQQSQTSRPRNGTVDPAGGGLDPRAPAGVPPSDYWRPTATIRTHALIKLIPRALLAIAQCSRLGQIRLNEWLPKHSRGLDCSDGPKIKGSERGHINFRSACSGDGAFAPIRRRSAILAG
jgi:hypothetical protein